MDQTSVDSDGGMDTWTDWHTDSFMYVVKWYRLVCVFWEVGRTVDGGVVTTGHRPDCHTHKRLYVVFHLLWFELASSHCTRKGYRLIIIVLRISKTLHAPTTIQPQTHTNTATHMDAFTLSHNKHGRMVGYFCTALTWWLRAVVPGLPTLLEVV